MRNTPGPGKYAPIIQLNVEMKNVVFGNSSLALIVLALLALLILFGAVYV